MDSLEIGVALIRKIDQQILWLGKLNEEGSRIDFVIAERLEKESWRETIMREVAWQLEIDRRRDIVVSNMAQLNVDFETTMPGTSTALTRINCAFYNVELYRKAALEKIKQNQAFVWLTSKEICSGVTESGIALNPLVILLNEKAKVIQHWESDALGEEGPGKENI